MKKTPHTRWTANNNSADMIDFGYTYFYAIREFGTGELVATVASREKATKKQKAEAWKRAKMIAAAPELFESAKKFVNSECEGEEFIHAIEDLNATVARIET